MQKGKLNTKISHLQKQIKGIQVDIKKLLQAKTMFNDTRVGTFMLTRTGVTKGYWEFINNKYCIVLNAGMKTSTNNIIVVEKSSRKHLSLFAKDPRILKVIQSELLALKKGLTALPMRHRQGECLKSEKTSPTIMSTTTKTLFSLLWDMSEKEALNHGVFFSEKNHTFQDTPFIRLEMINEESGENIRLIFVENESLAWYVPGGDSASGELALELNEKLKLIAA